MRGVARAGSNATGRQGGSGDVNLADIWPTITRVGAEREVAGEGWRVRVAPSGRVRVAPPEQSWTVLSFVYSESTTTEACHGTKPD